MGKYLKLFETHAEYESFIQTDYDKPNVSLCAQENEVHYNPWVETKVVAKFNVTSTSNETLIIGIYSRNAKNSYSEIEIDGIVQPNVVSAYTFDTLGEHTVKYTLKNKTQIAYAAFYSCRNLTSIAIPNSVTNMGPSTFSYCNSLTSVTFGNSITYINEYDFQDCSGLTEVTIPNSVTNIKGYAFSGCKSLTSITIPNSVTSIGNNAFVGCTSLVNIEIPDNVNTIKDNVFNYCSNLSNIIVKSTTPPTLGTKVFDNNATGRKIYVPSASVDAYKAAANWSTYTADIEPIPTALG